MENSQNSGKPNGIRDFSRTNLLPRAVAMELRRLIIDGTWSPGEQLPGENELTVELGVSRGTLRAALEELITQGFIVRRHGVGTFVHKRPLIQNNLVINSSATDMIRSIGMKPGSLEVEIGIEAVAEEVLANLDIADGREAVVVKRVRTADGKPVIFSVDYLSPQLLGQSNRRLTVEDLRVLLCEEEASFYHILEEQLGIRVDHALADLKPIKANALLVEKLKTPADSVLMCIHQIDYTKEGLPVMESTEYHLPETSTLYIFRKNE